MPIPTAPTTPATPSSNKKKKKRPDLRAIVLQQQQSAGRATKSQLTLADLLSP